MAKRFKGENLHVLSEDLPVNFRGGIVELSSPHQYHKQPYS